MLIGVAPQVEKVVAAGKQLFTDLFQAGLISADLQNACHQYIDALAALWAQGVPPPAWQIRPDPAPVVTLASPRLAGPTPSAPSK